MTKEIFIKELLKLKIVVTENQLELFDKYYQYLKEYNSHTNLTTIIEEQEVYLKHFYDSLTLNLVIDFHSDIKLLDIGSGAGFPGVVLKIIYPHLNVVLLDSNNKKTVFLTKLINFLNLQNIEVKNSRAEEYIKEQRESFDIVTARAVADLQVLAELALPYLKKEGYFIPLKAKVEEELKDSSAAINIIGGKITEVKKLELPIEKSTRNIIVIKKIQPTAKLYPRPYSQILKKPLKNFKK